MFTRRSFLKGAVLASIGSRVPSFLSKVGTSLAPGADQPALVVIQLDGGNDGLNAVVPSRHDVYRRSRPTLAIPEKSVLRIDDDLGWHPSLKPLAEIFDKGEVAIVRGVGVPNHDRSHFRSMATWHTARVESSSVRDAGWLAAAMASGAAGPGRDLVYVGQGTTPPALAGIRAMPISISKLDDLALAIAPSRPDLDVAGSDLSTFVKRVTVETLDKGARLESVRRDRTEPRLEGLAHDLDIVGRLIRADCGARVYYLEHGSQGALSNGSFDTHSDQAFIHPGLLRELATSISGFRDSMVAAGLWGRVAVLVFSEFGRRVGENGTRGTDHGSASIAWVVGGRVKGGLVGDAPSLDALEDGDLAVTTDFRRLYASILDGWLGVASPGVLSGQFSPLPIFRDR